MDKSIANKNRKIILITIVVVIGMFGFAFASIPLYNLICDLTGLSGRTNDMPYNTTGNTAIDKSRWVNIQFITRKNDDMPWEFSAQSNAVKVHPGELKITEFYVKNPTDKTITGQAIPSVTPFQSAQYFNKVECFCFNSQVLQPGEELAMPLRFIVDQDLPTDVNTITLSYTMYDITQLSATKKQ